MLSVSDRPPRAARSRSWRWTIAQLGVDGREKVLLYRKTVRFAPKNRLFCSYSLLLFHVEGQRLLFQAGAFNGQSYFAFLACQFQDAQCVAVVGAALRGAVA